MGVTARWLHTVGIDRLFHKISLHPKAFLHYEWDIKVPGQGCSVFRREWPFTLHEPAITRKQKPGFSKIHESDSLQAIDVLSLHMLVP